MGRRIFDGFGVAIIRLGMGSVLFVDYPIPVTIARAALGAQYFYGAGPRISGVVVIGEACTPLA